MADLQVFNYLAGSLSRIFTTLQEVDDKLILYGFIAGFALNAVLAAQMVYYWNAPTKKSTKGKQKEKVVVPAPTGSTTATPKGKNPTTRRRGQLDFRVVDFGFLFLDSCSMRSQSGNLMRIQACLYSSPVMNDTRFRTEFCGLVGAQPVPRLAGVSLRCVTGRLHFFFCFLPISYDLPSSSGERLEFELLAFPRNSHKDDTKMDHQGLRRRSHAAFPGTWRQSLQSILSQPDP